ncbi:MAG: hypothetical protein NZ898_11960, partial [Myxococcota bacterium]|nr:hypothetical protein [Myxococcota bacterium]
NAGRDVDHVAVIAPRFEAFLRAYAEALDTGRFVLTDDGSLRHPDAAHWFDALEGVQGEEPAAAPSPDWDSVESERDPALALARTAGPADSEAGRWIGRWAVEAYWRHVGGPDVRVAEMRLRELGDAERAFAVRLMLGLLGRLETSGQGAWLCAEGWPVLHRLTSETFVPLPLLERLVTLLADARAPDDRLGRTFENGLAVVHRAFLRHSGINDPSLRDAVDRLLSRTERVLGPAAAARHRTLRTFFD